MVRPAYRYRSIHALAEKVLRLIVALIPRGKSQPLSQSPRRVLVLKFGGMGEAVLARSLIEALRQRNPALCFDYLVEDRTVEVMTAGAKGEIFKYSPRTEGIGQALRILLAIRRRKYDAILDFEQDSLLTASFARATTIPVRIGFSPPSSSPRGRLFTHPVELTYEDSMWAAFIRAGRILDPGLADRPTIIPLPSSEEAAAWIDSWWQTHIGCQQRRVVAMHIGVGPSAQYRRWPTKRFAELAAVLGEYDEKLTIVLTGAKSEQSLISDFRSVSFGRSIDASELGGLERVAALLCRCDLLISNDTGIMHLGASIGTPTVGLFGASNPAWWAPVGPRATYVYATTMLCSPCINSYLRIIPDHCIAASESACMLDIKIDDVLKAARSVIRDQWLG